MSISDLSLNVSEFNVFREAELQAEIAKVAKLQTVQQGDIIVDIGQFIKSVPLILDGTVKIVREDDDLNEILLYYIEKGETCAMSLTCCLADARSEIRAIAVDEVKLLKIPVEYMDMWMQKYPSWKSFVMQSYRYRFEELLQTIDSIAFMKMDERLEKYLKDRIALLEDNIIHATHGEIAQDLNTSREVVSRLLKQLEKLGRVRLSRNKIELL